MSQICCSDLKVAAMKPYDVLMVFPHTNLRLHNHISKPHFLHIKCALVR